MFPETKPIIIKCPSEWDEVEIYPVHDLHYGSECFDQHKWNALHDEILSKPNRYVLWVGDLMENAVPNSKSNPLEQLHSPLEQREYITQMFNEFKDRTIAIVDGNHEYNRSTRFAGLYPLYDAACIAGIDDKYRSAYAVLDISVGRGSHRHPNEPFSYIGFLTHKAKELKSFGTIDSLDGFDFMCYGHDHEPKDRPRMKLAYNRVRKTIAFKPVETINCGSFLKYGGYGAHGGYRPQSNKSYKLVLHGNTKRIDTAGFYAD